MHTLTLIKFIYIITYYLIISPIPISNWYTNFNQSSNKLVAKVPFSTLTSMQYPLSEWKSNIYRGLFTECIDYVDSLLENSRII